MTQAWIEIELDTTPPEPVGSPADLALVATPYVVDIEFDQMIDADADVHIIDSGGAIFPATSLDVAGARLQAEINLIGCTPGSGTLVLGVKDDVFNFRSYEHPIVINGGMSILMEVPERGFSFDTPERWFDYELPAREFNFDLNELD